MLFPTTIVGSYPQPEWLIDRAKLAGRFPPRVRARELWRIPEPWLAQAQSGQAHGTWPQARASTAWASHASLPRQATIWSGRIRASGAS